MESIKLSLYDVFSFTLPGIFILLGIFILFDKSAKSVQDIITALNNMTITIGIFSLLLAYVLGFTFDQPSRWYYRKIGCKLFYDPKNKVGSRYNFDRQKEHTMHAMIREKYPESNSMLDTWKLLKIMSHNLSFAFLLLVLFLLIKIIFFNVQNILEWCFLFGGCLLISPILLYRAVVFDAWFYAHLIDVITEFNPNSDSDS